MLGVQQKIAPTKAKPPKGGDAKPRAYVQSGYGSRAAEGTEGSESAALIRCGSRASFCLRPIGRRDRVPSFRFHIAVRSADADCASATLARTDPPTLPRPSISLASKGEVVQSHPTP